MELQSSRFATDNQLLPHSVPKGPLGLVQGNNNLLFPWTSPKGPFGTECDNNLLSIKSTYQQWSFKARHLQLTIDY
jgi:hypothetical protein